MQPILANLKFMNNNQKRAVPLKCCTALLHINKFQKKSPIYIPKYGISLSLTSIISAHGVKMRKSSLKIPMKKQKRILMQKNIRRKKQETHIMKPSCPFPQAIISIFRERLSVLSIAVNLSRSRYSTGHIPMNSVKNMRG